MEQKGIEAALALVEARILRKEAILVDALEQKRRLSHQHRKLVNDRHGLSHAFGTDHCVFGTHAFAGARRRKLQQDQSRLQPDLARAALAVQVAREDLQAERRRRVGIILFLEKAARTHQTDAPIDVMGVLILAKRTRP